MAILPGKRLGPYEILSAIGAGGMGEVYEARDAKLGRKVAIKVLPASFVDASERLSRFQREARILAALNHPNIATIHGLEHSDGVHYLVMELVLGETLRERTAREGAMPIEEALKIALQIAEALEAAHEKGIIHRDLKPANVKVTPEGRVKVLDFGLAKAFVSDAAHDLSQLPTLTIIGTEEGKILGTPAYMSPEQARGKAVDKRTDIWAFGSVLYESLTGRQAFLGDTFLDVIVALEREPDWQALPASTPAEIRNLLRRCLHKDCQCRLRDIGDARIEIGEALSASSTAEAVLPRGTVVTKRQSWKTISAVCSALVLILGGLWWWSARVRTTRPELVERELTANTSDNPVYAASISPDGRYLAFADYDGVFMRVLETGETHKIPLPEGLCFRCASLSWFRGGTNLAVVGPGETGRPALWLISIFGGAPRKLRDDVTRASVSPDGSHIGFIRQGESEVWVMKADGEDARKVADAGEGGRFVELQWSPDGHRLAYLKTMPEAVGNMLEVGDLNSGVSTLALADSRLRTFCWVPDGRIILSRAESLPNEKDSNLWELRSDNRSGRFSGEPRRITDWPGFSFWDLTATSDGKRLAFVQQTAHMTVYAGNLTEAGSQLSQPRRLTLDEQDNLPSAWTPDSKAVLFFSDRNGNWSISKQDAQQRAVEDFVTGSEELTEPRLSPDKSWVLYWSHSKSEAPRSTSWRLFQIPLGGGASEPVLDAPSGSNFRCPVSANASCILGEATADRKQIVFTAFDPKQGRKAEVARIDIVPSHQPLWDLSPDGSVLAISDLDQRANHVLTLDLSRRASKDLEIQGTTGVSGLSWSSDGDALFITCLTSTGSDLVKLALDGKQYKLWTTTASLAAPVPSADGKKLTFAVSIQGSNAWTIENF